MYMHAHGSGQSQRVLSLFYNLYYTFYLVKCQKSNILIGGSRPARNIHDLQATPVSTRRCESEMSWQLEAACTGVRQH
jgi:hypothetical protein